MKLYRTRNGILAEDEGRHYSIDHQSWDDLVVREDLAAHVRRLIETASPLTEAGLPELLPDLLPPIGTQEVWAAGVTYYRSRNARME